jgi:N-acetylglucosamine kinase-like BadF-type ATPase
VAIFLGIDGGGSKTSCLIGDETSVLGSGVAGGSNMIRVGELPAREAIAEAIRQACTKANITPRQVKQSCMGAAGSARPEIAKVMRGILADLVSGEIEVVGDMVIAMEAAFGSGPGVIVISGTGSIAYGRNTQGETARAGGWGITISDEGSGHWIGRAAVAACMRSLDQTESAGALLRNIQKCWGVSTHEQVVVAANALRAPDFAALLPAVLSAEGASDAAAGGVLTQAGVELANLANIVMERIFKNARKIPVAMAGGVFSNCETVRRVFCARLSAINPGVLPNTSIVDPVTGALALARKGRVRS